MTMTYKVESRSVKNPDKVMLIERSNDDPSHSRTFHGILVDQNKARLNDGRVVKIN